jgi:hypothetical protein
MISMRLETPGFSTGSWLLQVLYPRAFFREDALRNRERLAVARVEALGDVPRQLDVLPLVVPDRDDVGLVQEDVARHQHGIVEESRRDELLLVGLLLELRHTAQLAEARHGAEQPRRLGMRQHVALGEDRRAVRVEPHREQQRRHGEGRLAQGVGLVVGGDRVQVDDAEEPVALFLGADVLAEAAAVVPERLVARGADAGENARSGGGLRFGGGHGD